MRLAAFAILVVSGTAAAQDELPTRARQERGTVVLSDANRASFEYGTTLGNRQVALVLAPTVDVFVNRHLTVGAALDIGYRSTSGSHSFGLGGDARLGFYTPLGHRSAFWPTVALGAGFTTVSDQTYALEPDGSFRPVGGVRTLRARLDAPFLQYPAPGFFVGAGPTVGILATKESGDSDVFVSLGLVTTLGGTF